MTTVTTIPMQVLKEAVGHVVQVELVNREEYRGSLLRVEDSMNVTLQNVAHTARDGKKSTLEEVYLRGTSIRLFVLPSALSNAPVLKLAAAAVSKPVAKSKKEPPPNKKQRMG
jgi:small nuclear ribonucleoprotein D3